jgi:hypothetical protein
MAAHAADTASDGRRRLLEEHSAAFRWLMASFLAINGGGLVFLKDLEIESPTLRITAATAFYLGIVSALAIAWLGQRSARAAVEPMSKLSVFWAMTAEAGEIDEGELTKLNNEISAVTAKARLAPVAGWASLLSFTVGLALLTIASSAQ